MENCSSNNKSQLSSLRGGTTKQSNTDCFVSRSSFLAMTRRLQNSIKSPFGLLILFIFSFFAAHAQYGYNKLYTNQASASYFNSVAPQGSKGNSMVMALANDSSHAGESGIRISRISPVGEILASNYFNIPNPSKDNLYPANKAVTRINDNLYAYVGGYLKPGIQMGFIMLADSNGTVVKFKEIAVPLCGGTGRFMYIADVGYDSSQNQLLVLGHAECGGDTMSPYLLKYDTALNLIWDKVYAHKVFPTNGMFRLLIDADGYTMCGGARFSDELLYNYEIRSIIIHTDTAGNYQWYYSSPASERRGFITTAIRTADKGYVYSVMGKVYNRKPFNIYPAWYGKILLVKLDSNRREEYAIPIHKPYLIFGSLLFNNKLINYDKNTLLFKAAELDSVAIDDWDTHNNIIKYHIDGTELWRKIYNKADDTTGGALSDICLMPDKSIVMVGIYDDPSYPPPTQRGWAIRVDSNGCYGVGDPQCWSVSIKEPKVENTIKIYPNPSYDFFEIDNTNSEKTTLKITDIVGRIVYQNALPKGISQIDARQWAAGLYLYTMYEGNKIIGNGKLLKY